jgi:dTDP-4-dehydrorhamnose reductase
LGLIVGKGDIASVLTDREDRIYFASGVSNSGEEDESAYKRERELLYSFRELCEYERKKLIYFSSLCVFYSSSRYAMHKRYMEVRVKEYFPDFAIMRIGNITWGNNPHTLINFIKGKIAEGKDVVARDVCRYLVGKEEFLHWINLIPKWNCEINITGKMITVHEIIEEIKAGRL